MGQGSQSPIGEVSQGNKTPILPQGNQGEQPIENSREVSVPPGHLISRHHHHASEKPDRPIPAVPRSFP